MTDDRVRSGYWVDIPNAPPGGPYCFWVPWPPRKPISVMVLTTGPRLGLGDPEARFRRGECMYSDVGYRAVALGGKVYYSDSAKPGHYFRQIVDGRCGRFQEHVRR